MAKQKYAVIFEQGEDGCIVAHVPALKGAWSQRRTRTEALANIREAIELHVEALRANNVPIPLEDDELAELAA